MQRRSIARVLWAGPWSLIGLLLLGLFFRHRSVTSGVILCEGAEWPQRLGWHYSAITLGHVVLSMQEPIAPQVFQHELVHVRQYEMWGPLFVPAYLIGSLKVRLDGRHPYWDNPFEVAARSAGR